jgi:hypothetical protein
MSPNTIARNESQFRAMFQKHVSLKDKNWYDLENYYTTHNETIQHFGKKFYQLSVEG